MIISNMISNDIKSKLQRMVRTETPIPVKTKNNTDGDPKTEREWRELMGEFKDRLEKRGGAFKKTSKRKL